MAPVTVVHYLNQFFGGIGGEEQAGTSLVIRDGPVGPGRLLQQALGGDGVIVATIIAGDNYVADQSDQAQAAIGTALDRLRPDVVVAGPAFDAGRYGLACTQVCRLAEARALPAVTAMHPENAGLSSHRQHVLCLPTGRAVTEMGHVMTRLAGLALRLGRRQPLGSAEEEGYLPRGRRRPVVRANPGAELAVDKVLARVNDRPFTTEIPVVAYDQVAPPPPVADLAACQLAIITSGGLVPQGNPDHLPSAFAEQYFCYPIADRPALAVGEWESIHGGYSTRAVNSRNPNFVVPLDVLRELEAERVIGGLYPAYFVTVGNGTAVSDARRMGAQIAEELKDTIGAALFVAT